MEDVLSIEEEDRIGTLILGMAEENAWRVESARDGEGAEQWMRRRQFQVVVLDLRLGAGRGEALLARLKQTWPQTQFVVVAPEGDAARGYRALKLGAYECLVQPLERWALEASVRRASERSRLGTELRSARLRDQRRPELLGSSPAVEALRETLIKTAGHESSAILIGEMGSGRRLAARLIHHHGSRRKGPFISMDCTALGQEREHELFGRAMDPGALELAAGGVLLLEHVERLGIPVQAKLLRALQDRGFSPAGSQRFVPLDARVLASADPSLRLAIREGAFREDLFWALGPAPIEVPPLRDHAGDIRELFRHFLRQECENLGRQVPHIQDDILAAMENHAFPGNIAELKALARLAAAESNDEIGMADLPAAILISRDSADGPTLKEQVHAFERQMILRALKAVRGNQSRAAERLKVHRNTLILKMQELEIPNKRTLKRVRVGEST